MIKFRIQKLKEIIENINKLCRIKVSIFDEDYNEILYYPEKYNSFCSLIRKYAKGEAKCHEADVIRLEEVKQTREVKKYICPHGLVEVFSPIIIENNLIGFITLGQILPEDFKIDDIIKRVSYLDINPKVVEESLMGLEKISEEHLKASMFLINVCTKYIYFDDSIDIFDDKLIEEIKEYINDHLSEKISVDKLCEHFYLSRVSLYRVFDNFFNMTVAEYIKKQKLNSAKKIIEHNPTMSINNVAEQVGMDYNYFSKVFFKQYKITPKKYQMQIRS